MGELGALFNPGMRHELEERRARAARREEEGNARDGDLRIDLESGVAVISAQDGDADGSESERAAPEPDSAIEPDSPARPGPSAGADSPSPAPSASADPASDEATPAPLRPRGKRATAASRR